MSGHAGGGAGVGAVVRQGHLRKLKTMKKKYFVLRSEISDGARLEYYESEKKFRAGAAPRRVLPLKSCYNIMRRLDLKQKHVIALFTREEQFCVVAENEKELHEWLTAILKQHGCDDASEELLHPIQHVWQVNVQKKGLGASKNIQGLYNLCLTDKTLALVKIKSHNNVIRELTIPERIEYSLKNIRRCGDSECFFYMEVGRQTATGAGELWMHSDDSNIAQSMHSTIYLAMKNCSKEDERDHIPLPKTRSADGANPPRDRSHSMYSDSKKSRPLSNDSGPRSRCESMPSASRASSFEVEKPLRHDHVDGLETSRDEPDAMAEWCRTPRIPEEPDCCDISKDFPGTSNRTAALTGALPIQHSRTSSLGVEEEARVCGYLPMAPHEGLVSASSGSVCSGTPSTDPRFSEYQLEPATSHIVEGGRPPRAYSVGSRPARADPPRHRAYSVGAPAASPARPHPASAPLLPLLPHLPPLPLLPRASAEDLMELDFSANSANSANSQLARSSLASLAYTPVGHRSGSPATKVVVARTPPTTIGFMERRPVDEYVDMSPRNAGYVEMRPGDAPRSPPTLPTLPTPTPTLPTPTLPTPDGYVEMNYTRAPTRPIAISQRAPPPSSTQTTPSVPSTSSAMPPPQPSSSRRPASPTRPRSPPHTPLGSQTLFPLSLESPASPVSSADVDEKDIFDEDMPEELARPQPPPVSCSPQYVLLRDQPSAPIAAPPPPTPPVCDGPHNPTATKTLARLVSATPAGPEPPLVVAGGGCAGARFVPLPPPAPAPSPALCPLNYAALDLEPRRGATTAPHRTYTQIDFVRSEKLAADGS
ncbi:insulin receptor substrate 1 isoform X5 [Plodia interpunctella]|uniref:insulin receptor substrate 1 isoform X5 n=1 Tax=Plodia interpunctella TaxID=58824 RepID=UPI0023674272|nr:insulin receptor substrate 1 isoform X5 [Plodia interpunctella]